MSESAPYHGLFAKAFYQPDIMVGESPEFFYYLFLGIRVFVGTDMHTLAHEYRVVTFQVFFEQIVCKLIGFRFE